MGGADINKRVDSLGWLCAAVTVIPSVGYLLALSVLSKPLSGRIMGDSPISWALFWGVFLALLIVFVAGLYIYSISRLESASGDT